MNLHCYPSLQQNSNVGEIASASIIHDCSRLVRLPRPSASQLRDSEAVEAIPPTKVNSPQLITSSPVVNLNYNNFTLSCQNQKESTVRSMTAIRKKFHGKVLK